MREDAIVVEPDLGALERVRIYPRGLLNQGFWVSLDAWEEFVRDIKRGVYDD